MSTPKPSVAPARTSRRSRQGMQKLERQLARALAPLDWRALAIAIGTTSAVAVALLTVASLLIDPERRFPLYLLAQYLRGYTVSWPGVGVGAVWAFGLGFLGGALLASIRNLVLTVWLMKVRITADVDSSREMLDHI